MDKNQSNNPELRLLELGLQAGDRGLLEWLEATLIAAEQERLPSIQID